MPIIGAFMGGGISTVPAGSSQIILQWYTNDGANLKCTFSLVSSSKTYNITSDDHGYAEAIVDSGEYTISVSHDGKYEGDKPVVRTLNSTESYNVIFRGLAYVSGILISNNLNFTTHFTIKDSGGSVVQSGILQTANTSIGVPAGTYSLELDLYGDTRTISDIDVISGNVAEIDLTGFFCEIVFNGITPSNRVYLIHNSNSIYMPDKRIQIFRDSAIKTFGFEDLSVYSGLRTDRLCSITDVSIAPQSESVTVSPGITGNVILLTSDGSLRVPVKGTFNVIAIGGGGKGGGSSKSTASVTTGGSRYVGAAGGGGGGDVQDVVTEVPADTYDVTIGLGAKAPSVPGGITSFGQIVSASGGANASTPSIDGTAGASGGSGGGGGGPNYYTNSSSQDSIGKKGGNATFGGGGGNSGCESDGYIPATGGAGGTHGGAGGGNVGGGTSSTIDNRTPVRGRPGQIPPVGSIYYGPTANGGASGGVDGAGSGGGGGYGADGGAGGAKIYGGGGGGGGMAGGAGGAGGGIGGTYGEPGRGGYGYGAGGGGGGRNSTAFRGGGGGGGGGYGSAVKASDGQIASETDANAGGNGADGCCIIQWRSN